MPVCKDNDYAEALEWLEYQRKKQAAEAEIQSRIFPRAQMFYVPSAELIQRLLCLGAGEEDDEGMT